MAGINEFFGRFWVWCISLFGSQNYNNSGNDIAITSFLQVVQINDVTSNGNDFLNRNLEFYRNMSERHGSPDFKLNWHFMSGAAVFSPKLNSNILFERIFYSLDAGKGHRSIVDKSFIVYTPWSLNWSSQLAPTNLLKINETVESFYADDLKRNSRTVEGPEDPRVTYNEITDEISLNFNALTMINDRQMFGQTIKLSHKDNEIFYTKTEPLIQFEHPKGYRAKVEKNWVPILIKDELHYIYSLSPLRILKCDLKSSEELENAKTLKTKKDKQMNVSNYKKICKVQFKGESVDNGKQTGALRSGTNWIEFSPGIYFSFARTRIMHSRCSFAIYRPHFIVLKFNINSETGEYTDPHIISVSEPITEFDDKLFELYAKKGLSSGQKCDDQAVLTPGSISNWTGMGEEEGSDVADVIISVNDDMNVLLKIKGFGHAVQKYLDSAPNSKKSRSISKKGTLIFRAEKEMKSFVEKSFSKMIKK